MVKRPVLALMSLVVAAAALSACGQGGEPAAGADGALTYAVGDEPETFNPGLQDEHTDPVTELVFRGLTRHDKDNKVVPGLAKSWEVAPDGRTYTFALRPGTTWQDGRPFTSDDVKFTVEAIKDAGADSPLSRNFSMVTAVETPDPATVRLKLDEPFAPMLDALAMGMLPKHLLQGKKLTDPDFGRRPVGTGPFTLKTYKPGQYAELTAFDGYYEGEPRLKKIVIKYVPDDSARLIQLKNGEVDAANLAPQQAGKAGGHRLEVYPTADYRALMFNMKDPVFADRRVRTAMNYAVDREAITKSVVLGYGTPAKGPLDAGPYAAAPGFTFDPAKVSSLMGEAGYAKNGQGMWAKDGKTVDFELTTFAEDSLRVAILNVSATQLRKQGFDVDPRPRPRDWVRKHWGDLQGMVVGWGTPYDPDSSVYGVFASSQALAKGGSNYGTYSNPAVDKALEEGRSTLDPAKRKAAYTAFQKALQEDPPFVWISYLKTINAVPKNLTGPAQRTLGHHGYGFFWNAETWRYN
ncbi:ABC transporter substrate-binding protein [Actinomadura sp. NAK00032]|uniref:ABC transporter substrate-binding protein n=1 Tax=Actinomadura sp. NAK00032 TaxID=2742128 RepID=UPI0020C76847|nr:ABC transporter substrate-binding protein [Actinomadura sp. NAK00032]